MGESRIAIFAYVDESGNTGKNIFDEAQPDYYTAALVNKGDFDAIWSERIKAIARRVGADAIHANELGIGRLEGIAGDLYTILETSRAHFFVSRVEKLYLLAVKMFDVLFDSGENAAVAWHNYNVKPLKLMYAFKFATIIDHETARAFWDCLLLPREEDSRKRLPKICEALKGRLHIVPDERSREVIGEGLDWVIKHPESIHFAPELKIARKGHFPNLVAFANLLRGLDDFSQRWNRKIARITHDEQSEFGGLLQSWHEIFSNASPDEINWAGEKFRVQTAPGSQFVIKRDRESPGIQMADVALWLYGQSLKGKRLPPRCASILNLVLERGWHDDFSFKGVHAGMMEKWGKVFFGPIEPERFEAAKAMLDEAEKRRLASMAQFELDGLPPFTRSTPSQIKS